MAAAVSGGVRRELLLPVELVSLVAHALVRDFGGGGLDMVTRGTVGWVGG